MTDLAIERSTYGRGDRRWLRSHVGFRDTLGVTLDGNLFSAQRFPDGTVLSGTVIAKVDATELYGPYDPAATDGRQKAENSRVFFLLEEQTVRPGHKLSCAGIDSGRIIPRYLPAAPTGVTGPAAAVGALNAAVRTALPRVGYLEGENV